MRKPGYILPTTLFLLAGLTTLVVGLLRYVTTAQAFSEFTRDRVYARSLALSGLEVAKSQMARPKKEGTESEEQAGLVGENEYVLHILEYVNQWQHFDLTYDNDGIDGSIYMYITPERGKIPINTFFDRDNKQITKEAQDIIPYLQSGLESYGMESDLKAVFDEMAQKAPRLDDPSQLFTYHSAFSVFDERRFLRLQRNGVQQGELTTLQVPVLFDTITTFVDLDKLSVHPLFFSESIQSLLGLASLPSGENRSSFIQTIKENMQDTFNWERDWNTLLAPVYKKQFEDLPEAIRTILANESRVTRFSVISYGQVEETYVCLYAIIERVQYESYDTFLIHRIYWI